MHTLALGLEGVGLEERASCGVPGPGGSEVLVPPHAVPHFYTC